MLLALDGTRGDGSWPIQPKVRHLLLGTAVLAAAHTFAVSVPTRGCTLEGVSGSGGGAIAAATDTPKLHSESPLYEHSDPIAMIPNESIRSPFERLAPASR